MYIYIYLTAWNIYSTAAKNRLNHNNVMSCSWWPNFLLTSWDDLQHSGHRLPVLPAAQRLHEEKILCLLEVWELMRGNQGLLDVVVDDVGGQPSTRSAIRSRESWGNAQIKWQNRSNCPATPCTWNRHSAWVNQSTRFWGQNAANLTWAGFSEKTKL